MQVLVQYLYYMSYSFHYGRNPAIDRAVLDYRSVCVKIHRPNHLFYIGTKVTNKD